MPVLQVEHLWFGELEIVKCDFERVDLKLLSELTLHTVSCWFSPQDAQV
jgi:hypothetical protein